MLPAAIQQEIEIITIRTLLFNHSLNNPDNQERVTPQYFTSPSKH